MELFLQELKFSLLFFPLSNFEEICLDVMFWAKFFGKLKSNDIFLNTCLIWDAHLPKTQIWLPTLNSQLTASSHVLILSLREAFQRPWDPDHTQHDSSSVAELAWWWGLSLLFRRNRHLKLSLSRKWSPQWSLCIFNAFSVQDFYLRDPVP